MRCASISATVCSTRAGSRPSVKQAATRSSKRILRLVRRNSRPPPSLLIQAPSNWATTRREKWWANAKLSWLHSVMRKAVSFSGIDFVSTPQLCLKTRPFSTVNYSWLFTTGEKSGLAGVPGFGADSAQQVIAEVGAQASTFASAAKLTSWVGTCPGQDESAEQNHSSRSAKGNKYLRRIMNQAAHAAVKKQGSHFQAVFRRLLPRLGYKGAVWAVAHRLCRLVWKVLHDGVQFVERGSEPDPRTKRQRALKLLRTLRRLGYQVDIKPAAANLAAATR